MLKLGAKSHLSAVLSTVDPSLEITSEGSPDLEGFRTLELSVANDSNCSEPLLKAITADGRFRLRALSRAQPTLEDVFLAATKRSWDIVDRPAADPKAETLKS